MINKIIQELEQAKKYQIPHIEAGIEIAIEIIKKYESEFEDKRIKNAIAYINGGLDGAEFNGVDEIYGKSQVVEILNDIKKILNQNYKNEYTRNKKSY